MSRRIEIAQTISDARAEKMKERVRSDGIPLKDLKLLDVYTTDLNLSEAHSGKVSEMLINPVFQKQISGIRDFPKFDYAVEVGFLPGVTDNVGHSLVTLTAVLADFANDMRILYSSAIGEVTSRDNAERLGGSSTDAAKNNPINYENIAGKAKIVESGMCVLYGMIQSDLQRDLRNSVMARYQPQNMMVETHEMFSRFSRTLDQLSINEDRMEKNLEMQRSSPSEALVTILRGSVFMHSQYGEGHNFVKVMSKHNQKTGGGDLISRCLVDKEFKAHFDELPSHQQDILLNGKLENYTGHAEERTARNVRYARDVVAKRF